MRLLGPLFSRGKSVGSGAQMVVCTKFSLIAEAAAADVEALDTPDCRVEDIIAFVPASEA